jgi:hypothetical protein
MSIVNWAPRKSHCAKVMFFLFLSAWPDTFAAGCPDPNSRPYVTKGGVTHCECIKPDYMLRGPRCVLVRDIRVQLEKRLREAQKGGRQSLQAWAHSSAAAVGSRALQHANVLGIVDGLLHASGSDFELRAAELEIALTQYLSGIQACDGYADQAVRTSCENLHVFHRLVKETNAELKQLP